MAESAIHIELVGALVRWVESSTYLSERAGVFVSLPTTTHHGAPPAINGAVPDLFLKDESAGVVVIGEAKTAWDIESPKTRYQLGAYIQYLAQFPRGTLVLAVPWHCVNQMRSLIRALCKRLATDCVRVVVLDQLAG